MQVVLSTDSETYMIHLHLFSVRSQSKIDFFFQAEDGIRDHCVTGVQTCALQIYTGLAKRLASHVALARPDFLCVVLDPTRVRSEERRVGKECRSGWWADPGKKNGADRSGLMLKANKK